MIFLRPVSPQSHSDAGLPLPQFLAAGGSPEPGLLIAESFVGRIFRAEQGMHLSALCARAFESAMTYMIRGLVLDQWDAKNLAENLERQGIGAWLTERGPNQYFIAQSQNPEDLAKIQLLEWGDFAFTAGTNLHHLRQSNDWNPSPAHPLNGAEVDIVELAWNGAFDLHGVYSAGADRIAEFVLKDPEIIYNPREILLDESDVLGEGRRGWDLFD